VGEMLAQGTSNGLPLCGLKLLSDLWISQLQPWHAWHEHITPSKDVGGGIDEIRPGDRNMRTLMQEARVELFGRELPPEERFASQHVVALGTADKDILSKRSKGN